MRSSNNANWPEPSNVFALFAALSAVPRGSHHEEAIGEWLLAFAHECGLEAHRDAALNVVIRKPGACGGETAPGVILQSHVDMVWAREDGSDFDFPTRGIEPRVDGGRLRANGTTLGADNGIGMAYALALLDSRGIPHPPLEAVFTVQEETGMHGALAFDASVLNGKYFVNMDSEAEGVFCVSCCGGITARAAMPVEELGTARLPDAAERVFASIRVDGLQGGHSGVEIDKQRGNANRLLARALYELDGNYSPYLARLHGGLVDNAIPVDAVADVFVREGDLPAIAARLAELEAVFRNELRASGGGEHQVRVTICPCDPSPTVFSRDCGRKALWLANLLPDGVEAMDLNFPGTGLVETSSNFAMMRRDGNRLCFIVSVRSSLESKRKYLLDRIALLAKSVGAVMAIRSGYPAWEYRPDSELVRVFQRAYASLHSGAEAKEEGIHAGLECGVFDEHFRRLGREAEMISIGPDVSGAHTPEESLDIASAARTWDLLCAALALLAEKENAT